MARVNYQNLIKYQKAQRQIKAAKQMAKLSSAKSYVAEYEAYQKEYYRISKSLRNAGVKLKKGWNQGLFKAGKVFNFASRGEIMSLQEFGRYKAKYTDLSAIQIAAKQYNLLDIEVATELQRNLKEAGLGEYSLDVIRARQLPDAVWQKMEMIAYREDTTVSEYFFGSN